MDGGTWEVEWADSLRKSDAGLWEACPAAITLVGVQSLIWSWALCYLNPKDLFEAWALSFWHITWVIPVKGKKGWWCSCFFLILFSSRGSKPVVRVLNQSTAAPPKSSLPCSAHRTPSDTGCLPRIRRQRKCRFLILEMCVFSQQACTVWALRIAVFTYWSRRKFRLKENLFLFVSISEP